MLNSNLVKPKDQNLYELEAHGQWRLAGASWRKQIQLQQKLNEKGNDYSAFKNRLRAGLV